MTKTSEAQKRAVKAWARRNMAAGRCWRCSSAAAFAIVEQDGVEVERKRLKTCARHLWKIRYDMGQRRKNRAVPKS